MTATTATRWVCENPGFYSWEDGLGTEAYAESRNGIWEGTLQINGTFFDAEADTLRSIKGWVARKIKEQSNG